MTDRISKQKRSVLMSRIRGKNTGPERALRSALWRSGLRFRIHSKIPGTPDIVFPSKRVVVFVDGCFWHRCPSCYSAPSNNRMYWMEKAKQNVKRDKKVNSELRSKGWLVFRFWEHELAAKPNQCLKQIVRVLRI